MFGHTTDISRSRIKEKKKKRARQPGVKLAIVHKYRWKTGKKVRASKHLKEAWYSMSHIIFSSSVALVMLACLPTSYDFRLAMLSPDGYGWMFSCGCTRPRAFYDTRPEQFLTVLLKNIIDTSMIRNINAYEKCTK